MNRGVTLIDYGIGNLYSVRRALETCGAEVTLSADAEEISKADRLVLPGVGAFADGMAGLRERNLVDPIRQFAASGRPMLGICLGMQLFATVSEEFGTHPGLDVMPGRVVPLSPSAVDGTQLKIPNIGWRELHPAREDAWVGSALSTTRPGQSVYLVHSFHLVPDDPRHVLATCNYGGHVVTAAVRDRNLIGCQFHPEKSGAVGLAILERFVGA